MGIVRQKMRRLENSTSTPPNYKCSAIHYTALVCLTASLGIAPGADAQSKPTERKSSQHGEKNRSCSASNSYCRTHHRSKRMAVNVSGFTLFQRQSVRTIRSLALI